MEFFDLISIPQYIIGYFMGNEQTTLEGAIANTLNALYISYGVAAGLYLICLIFGGLGLYRLAKRANIAHAWLGFLPFGNTWIAGKLAGEASVFGKKMKRVHLYAVIAEVLYVATGVFVLAVSTRLYDPAFFKEVFDDLGQFAGWEFDSSLLPISARGIYTAQTVMEILNYITYAVMLFFLCVLFFAFFKKYYARSPFLMAFLCAFLPLRGFVLFAVRNNAPVDYAEYVRSRMQAYSSGGSNAPRRGYGDNDGYGDFDKPQGGDAGKSGSSPFSEFGESGNGGNGGNGGSEGGGGNDDSPFSDF